MVTTGITYVEAIKNGDALAWQDRWEESLTYYRQALLDAPNDIFARSSLGSAYMHLGRFEEALAELEHVLKALPQDALVLGRVAECYSHLGRLEECTTAYLALGEWHMQLNNDLLAIVAWRKLLSILPDHEEGRAKLAEALVRRGEIPEAAAQYAALASALMERDRPKAEQLAFKALELHPVNPDAQRLLAALKSKDGRAIGPMDLPGHVQPSPERTGLDDLLVEPPPSATGDGIGRLSDGNSDQLVAGASVTTATSLTINEVPNEPEGSLRATVDSIARLMSGGLYLAALDECYQAIGVSPTYLPIHLRVGEIHAARGRSDEAVEKYAVLADAHLVRGDVDNAIEMRRRILELYPDDFERRLALIHLLVQCGRKAEALEQQLLLAESHARARQLNRAIADFREALRMAPDTIRIHLQFARLLADMGRTGEAIREYEEAIALDPTNWEALLRLSIANRLAGDFEEAQECASRLIEVVARNADEADMALRAYKEAIEAHAEVSDFSAWAGLLLGALGRMAEAAPYLERGLEGTTEIEAIKPTLCRCYLAQGMHAKAVALLKQISADRATEIISAFRQEADRLGREGRWGDVAALLEAVRKEEPQDDGILIKLAEAHFRQGNVAGAVREFDSLGQLYLDRGTRKRAIAIFQVVKQLVPKTALPYVRLGDVFVAEGMTEEAIAEFEILADLQLKQGQVADGIATLRRIVRLDPDRAKGHLVLGEALFAARQFGEAAQVFRQLLDLDPHHVVAQSRLAAIRSSTGG